MVGRKVNGDTPGRNMASSSGYQHIIIDVKIPHKVKIIAVRSVGVSQKRHGK